MSLPTGWRTAALSEVVKITMGQSPPGSSYNISGDGLPFFQGKAEFGPLTATVRKWTTAGTKFAQAGDILLSVRAPVGPTNFTPTNCALGRGLAGLRSGPDLEPRFLFWNLRALQQDIAALGKGSTFEAITGRQLRDVRVVVPPLDEQQRIVDLLEDHLSRLDAAQRSVMEATARSRVLQNALIAKAVRTAGGSLTPLAHHVKQIRNGIFVSRASALPNGVPILRIGAVRPLHLELGDLRYSGRSEVDLQSDDALLAAEDLVFTRYNGNPRFVGACAVVPDGLGPLTYPDKLIRVRVAEHVDARFLAYACSVGPGRAQIQAAVKTTSGQAGISGKDLRTVEVRMPSLEEQLGAVEQVRAGLEALPDLTRELRVVERRGASLRRSLLAAAFSGRITVPRTSSGGPHV